MIHLGSVPAGTVLVIPFTTYGLDGASITCTGFANTDIEIYKNGSPTQRSSDSGVSVLGIDFDGITGFHGFEIDLANNADSGFFAVGSTYWVVVSSITVDGKTVSFIAAIFRIAPAESISGYPKQDMHAANGDAVAAANFAKSAASIVTCTVDTGSSTTSVVTSACSPAHSPSVADQFVNRTLIFLRDTTTVALRGQAVRITASTATVNPTLTVTALTATPASGDTFIIV